MEKTNTNNVPKAMTIAGSDSGGGAGIQADLKTLSALGVYGASSVTAITVQNTVGVFGVHEIPTEIISGQIDAVISDIGIDCIKIGMLSSSHIIECVADTLLKHEVSWLVVDPVMVAKSGDSLLREDALAALKAKLIPMASVVTPNIPEAETLTDMTISNEDDVKECARRIVGLGAKAVVVKGGHLEGPATDVLYDGTSFIEFISDRIPSNNTHGTGCTFASAITAGLAKNLTLTESVAQAKEFVTEAIRSAYDIGSGHGPLNHFFRYWN